VTITAISDTTHEPDSKAPKMDANSCHFKQKEKSNKKT